MKPVHLVEPIVNRTLIERTSPPASSAARCAADTAAVSVIDGSVPTDATIEAPETIRRKKARQRESPTWPRIEQCRGQVRHATTTSCHRQKLAQDVVIESLIASANAKLRQEFAPSTETSTSIDHAKSTEAQSDNCDHLKKIVITLKCRYEAGPSDGPRTEVFVFCRSGGRDRERTGATAGRFLGVRRARRPSNTVSLEM